MFTPILEVPADLLKWMNTKSQSAFVGDMLRLIQRNGGLTENQINILNRMKG